jgi:hypothetical protein
MGALDHWGRRTGVRRSEEKLEGAFDVTRQPFPASPSHISTLACFNVCLI